MSGIAQLLLRRGIKVSGSDLKETRITEELKRQGARIYLGHSPANIKDATLIIYSSAIRQDNPEIRKAISQGIPLLRRAQALAELMKDETVITVTGSHGKTTTASLISHLLLEAGFSPTIAVGGILRNIDTNAYLGDGRFFVAEADESDGSFLYYRPKYSIITNVDYEHLDYYKKFSNAISAFRKFLDNTRDEGCAFVCGDDTNLRKIIKDYGDRYLLFGLRADNHIHPENIDIQGLSSQFDCFYKNKLVGRFFLALGGEHNISNSLSVIALGLEMGIDTKAIKNALSSYKGAKRRIEVKLNHKYLVIDDYAHHPSEIRATLSALRHLKSSRLIAVFQPHRYTRTKLLLDEFGKSFALADSIIVTDIYPAGEEPIAGVSARLIYDKIKEQSPDKPINFLPKQEIPGHILKNIRPGDLVVTLGAGDIVKTCDELVDKLKGKSCSKRAA